MSCLEKILRMRELHLLGKPRPVTTCYYTLYVYVTNICVYNKKKKLLDMIMESVEVKPKFLFPVVPGNPSGWGPCDLPEQFKDVPYQPFSKADRVGKVN